MVGITSTYHTRLEKCLATQDRALAKELLAEVKGALAARMASGPGFDEDVIRLSSIAGVPLGKSAAGGSEPLEKRDAGPQLPPHLRHQAEDAIERIKNADGRLAKAAAMEHGRAIKRRLDDFWSGQVAAAQIRAAHRGPQRSSKS